VGVEHRQDEWFGKYPHIFYFGYMCKKINKYTRVISSLFLAVYLSFMALNLLHVHGENFLQKLAIDSGHSALRDSRMSSSGMAIDSGSRHAGTGHSAVWNSGITSSCDSEGECQICQLYSSINISPVSIPISSGMVFESVLVIPEDTDYITYPVNSNNLRGPPII
jgi:hypothetical protein